MLILYRIHIPQSVLFDFFRFANVHIFFNLMQRYEKKTYSVPHPTASYRFLPHFTAFYRLTARFPLIGADIERITSGYVADI